MKELLNKLKKPEVLRYLIFGVLATIVSMFTYWLAIKAGLDYKIAQALSWVFAVSFAFVTNKIFVFESKTSTLSQGLKEFCSFILARVISGVVETVVLIVTVEFMNMDEMIAKLITQVIVVILNYIFSKWFVFKKK